MVLGHDEIAKDVIDASFQEDLDVTFGGENTALHLATFLNARDVVKALLERGATRTNKNQKGFTPLDVVPDSQMTELYNSVA